MYNVISFALWGSDPSYIDGSLENIRLAKIHYPGWTCRFYVATGSPGLSRLQAEEGVEVIPMDLGNVQRHGSLKNFLPWDGIFWRLLPAADPSIDYFISRDCDGRLNAKEKAAVDEWIASGKSLHTMHVYFFHKYALHGGLWGCKGGAIPNMKEMIDEWFNLYDLRGRVYRESESDEKFLSDKIWPLFKNDYIGHGCGVEYTDSGDNEHPFPAGTVEHFDDFRQIKYALPEQPSPGVVNRRKIFGVKALTPQPPKPSTGKQCLILTGYLRNFKLAAPIIRRNFQGDIFVCTWDYLDLDHKEKTDINEVVRLLEPVATLVESTEIMENLYKAKYERVSKYKGYACGAHKGRKGWNSYHTFHSMKSGNLLRLKHEVERGFTYDRILKSRPDYIFRGVPEKTEPDTIYFPENANYQGATDNIAYGHADAMNQFFLCFDLMDVCLLQEDCRWQNEALVRHHVDRMGLRSETVKGFSYQNADGTPPGGDQTPVGWRPEEI